MTNSKGHRCGFVCLVGRPNVGKSTLTNALVGTKISITSNRPQTTRRVVRGIVHRDDYQIVVVDTPGIHRPRTLLGQRLNDAVKNAWSQVDVVGLCIPADQKVGPGDRFIEADSRNLQSVKRIAIVTKIDLVSPAELINQLSSVADQGDFADIVPVSAHDPRSLTVLEEVVFGHLPFSPPLYPSGEITDEPERELVGELIREAIVEKVTDELPHSVMVLVEEFSLREGRDDLLEVYAHIFVERPSQKGIIVGKSGSMLKQIGTQARAAIEEFTGHKVYLNLHVKVAKNWQSDPRQLRRLGFDRPGV